MPAVSLLPQVPAMDGQAAKVCDLKGQERAQIASAIVCVAPTPDTLAPTHQPSHVTPGTFLSPDQVLAAPR